MNGNKSAETKSDEALVVKAQRGDQKALAELASRFSGMKGQGTAGYLDGDDLHQEAMLALLSAVKTYSPDKGVPFSAYVSVCANNRVASAARRTKNDFPPADTTDSALADGAESNPLDRIVARERYSVLLDACENVLSDVEKTAIFCRMSGLSYAETAAKLGLSEKAVDNAVQRARRKLKNVIADEWLLP